MCGSRPVHSHLSSRSWRGVSSRARQEGIGKRYIVQLILPRLPRFLKTLAKSAAGITCK